MIKGRSGDTIMKVKFKLFANFREAAKKKEVEISFNGTMVSEAISALAASYPELNPRLYQDGQLKQYVNVLLNGQSVKGDRVASTPVKEGDEIALFPPVSGG
jgi:molybdopterin synthase sulfur carrier subunit